MNMQKLKWLAALPNVAGLNPQSKATLIVYFAANRYTVEQIVDLEQETLIGVIKFALQCDNSIAVATAQATTELLVDLIATADSPPSEAELKKFIVARQLQLQPKANMMSIYQVLTSDDATYNSFTVDPLTGKTFNPVWLQLAIEQLYGLDPCR